jgi:hypothetical protein
MSFIIYMLLFTLLCGWLDARITRQKKNAQ